MCPPASISPRLDINVSSSDEEVLLFLGRRKAGDPVPSNIITEVNPFSVEPWDSPEGMWYLYNLEDACSSSHRSAFKEAHIGYWSFMDHLTIYRGKVAAGRKTTWEFFIGREPLGNRTGWLMYDYQRAQKACQGIRAAQDCSSMCRVFLQEDQREIIGDRKSPDTERRGSNSAGERGESMLLRFLESEETSPRANAVNKFELGAPEPSPDRSIHDLITGDDSAPDLNPFVEFSKGEYLALEDLYGPESTSSTSDDSSLISTNSDECFDPEALLRDLDNVKASAKPTHPAAIRPSRSAGSNEIDNGGHRSADGELVLANSPPSDGSEQQPFSAGTAACSRRRGHPKRTHSGRSESSSSSNGPGSKSVGRIAKLGKKYCCFAASPAD